MSRPTNPLAEFRSYAYHHILVVGDTTEAVISATTNPNSDVGFDPRYPIRSGAGGSYMVLLNGTQTARIYIKSLRYKVIPVALTCCSSPTLSIEAQMTIVEPMGVRFLNILALAVQQLNMKADILEFALKTIFIGHTHDGQTKSLNYVQPLIFKIISIDSSFDETGGIYVIKMASGHGAAGKIPAIAGAASGFKITIAPGSTLEDVGKKMEEELNRRSKAAVDVHNKDANAELQPTGSERPYKFAVVIGDELKNVKVGVNTPATMQSLGTGDSTVDGGYNGTAESFLGRVIQDSDIVTTQINDAKALEDPNLPGGKRRPGFSGSRAETAPSKHVNKRLMYNVEVSEVTTKTAVEVTYNVVPYIQESIDTTVKHDPALLPVDIEFDYIFTARNTDIKNFDMQIQFLSNAFPGFYTSQNIPTQATNFDTGKGSGAQSGDHSTTPWGQNPGDSLPVVHNLPQPARNAATRNLAFPVDTMQFRNTFAQHLDSYNYTGAKLEIYGNPQLLADITPPYPSSNILGSNPPNAIARDPLKIPTTTRVNIKFPDEEGNLLDFWYRGAWKIGQIENIFENGDFTQVLTLVKEPSAGRTAETQPPTPDVAPIHKALQRRGKSQNQDTGVPFTGDEVDVLSRTICAEAGNQGQEGMEAVANVIINRGKQTNSPLSSVCLSRPEGKKFGQFSAWNAGHKPLCRSEQSDKIARAALRGELQDNTGGATFYIRSDCLDGPKSYCKGPGREAFVNNINNKSGVIGDHSFFKSGGSLVGSDRQLGGSQHGQGFNVGTAESIALASGGKPPPTPPAAAPQKVNANKAVTKDKVDAIKARQTI